jgi:DNA-binding transcriptional LysR family regulator
MFDPIQLRTFLVVAQTRGFSAAGRQLGVRQSTVSQHVRKLEDAAGRTLFLRDTHSVELTGDGEAMVGFAQAILDANERAVGYFAGHELRGRVRFGTSEDFVPGQLSDILRRFRRRHPLVDIELTVTLAGVLVDRLNAGELDLVLAKRRLGEKHGTLLWREKSVWAGAPGYALDEQAPVPLVMFPTPSITRGMGIDALRAQGKAWRIACTSGSLNGLRAAALAGLGVAVFAESLVPEGLAVVPARLGLPDPGDVEFVLMQRRSTLTGPVKALADEIVRLQRL